MASWHEHPHPEDLLARLTREQDFTAQQFQANTYLGRSRPRARDEARNFLVIFAVGCALTVVLLVLAGLR